MANLAILGKPDWHNSGSMFAAEQLSEYHQIEVGKEALRGWMVEAGSGSRFSKLQ